MAQATVTTGIDYDSFSIRAATLRLQKSGKNDLWSIDSLNEIRGNFLKDEDLVEGLRNIKNKAGSSGRITTCVGGKQTYTAQLNFRKMADADMKNALKFEIKKDVPFDITGATIDYQFLPFNDKNSATVPLMVTAVSNILLTRHLRLFEKAGLRPLTVDVFPLSVANSFWASVEKGTTFDEPQFILHAGPEICTLVIESGSSPFYNRLIYFSAAEIYGETADPNMADRERQRRTDGLIEEIRRSLAFYETTHHFGNFKTVHLTGGYVNEKIISLLTDGVGLKVETLDLAKKLDKKKNDTIPGKFDVAIALGMRS